MKEIMDIVLDMKAEIKALKADVAKIKKAGKAPAVQFLKPTWEQVAGYFHELGSNTCQDDAHAFIDHFTSNGWKVGGKTPMKCWRSAGRSLKGSMPHTAKASYIEI